VAYIFPEDLPGEIDFLNLEKQPWHNPGYAQDDSDPDTRSFPEIYAEAVSSAADTLGPVICKYLEEGFFPIKEAVQAIGNGGLSIVDREGKPCAPCRAGPLPLQKVLDEQAARRKAQ
jgi:hypothetical protein